ncbi:MAG: CRTAC1 family protein [Candidatus Poribacteria bacterium]|nr:CRTAC1 family protein [Candidatus Poribacteria bacterium]
MKNRCYLSLRPKIKTFLLICFILANDGITLNAAETTLHFTDQTRAAGIHFKHTNGASKQKYLPETMGAGGLFFDYNNDGHLDIYLVNSGTLSHDAQTPRPANHSDVLYRNNGDGTFTDVTAEAGLQQNHGYGMGCLAADYDNDGDADLYLTNFGKNQLYRNNGDGTFTDVTSHAGVADGSWSVSASFGDFNLDGYLDLYVTNYLDYQLETAHACFLEGVHIYCGPHEYPGASDTLYRNNGDGTFTDVTARAGLHKGGKGLGTLFTDYNSDGYPDIFVANDAVPDFLYRNNEDGTFTDVAIATGVAYNSEGRATASMGIATGDYDSDGLPDLFVTNFSLEINSLFHNNSDGFYTMTTFETGLADPSFSQLGFGTQFLDADNDGTLELFVANGHVWDNVSKITPSLSYKQRCQLFGNIGTGQYRDLSETAGAFFKRPVVARGVAIGDYNNDGAVDILVTCCGEAPALLRNDSQTVHQKHNWVKIRLVGTESNRDGIGAKVWVQTNKRTQFKEATCGGSYASSSDPTLHFGIGTQEMIQSIRVKWQSGRSQTVDFSNTENPVNQVIRIIENALD